MVSAGTGTYVPALPRCFRGVMQNPWYLVYPRVRPPPTFLQPRESSTRTSIDVAARFARWNGVEEEEEEEEGGGFVVACTHPCSARCSPACAHRRLFTPTSVLVVARVCARARRCSHPSVLALVAARAHPPVRVTVRSCPCSP